jgi:nuclear protein localization family protein 4
MCVRGPASNEMVPAIVTEGKNVKEFDPMFFIVNVAHGFTDEKKDYSVLKIRDFPAVNRGPPAKHAEFKGYL